MKLEVSAFLGFVLAIFVSIIICLHGQESSSDNDHLIIAGTQSLNSVNFSACDDEYCVRKIENQRGFNIKIKQG
jgi:hypothetical protein